MITKASVRHARRARQHIPSEEFPIIIIAEFSQTETGIPNERGAFGKVSSRYLRRRIARHLFALQYYCTTRYLIQHYCSTALSLPNVEKDVCYLKCCTADAVSKTAMDARTRATQVQPDPPRAVRALNGLSCRILQRSGCSFFCGLERTPY